MTSTPRPFSWGLTALFAGIINAAINAPIGWIMVKPAATLGIWSTPGVALDLAITAFAITFATTLLVTPQTRGQLASGKMLAPPLSEGLRARFAAWPSSTPRRALRLSVVTLLVCLPPALLLLWGSGVEGLDRLGVTWVKGGFSFVVGALVTPVIAAGATVQPNLGRAAG